MNATDMGQFGLPSSEAGEPIAIIGMAGRFPGADSVETFWRNVKNGVDSISHFTDEQLEDAFPAETRASSAFVRARPVLDGVDQFDAAFFGMYPREAALADPQHRVFLECAWTCLEAAGYDPAAYPGAIGVFAGCSLNTYFLHHICADRRVVEAFTSSFQLGDYPTLLGAGQDFLTTRVAYKLDLRGPAMTLGTACSSSLTAVAQACQTLRAGQADMMLAGGVSISFPQQRGYLHQEGGMASADGCCRPFDARASGTVFGSGAAVVLLKRLADAIVDGDTVQAVIRAVSTNNDGARKIGFTAPSVEGQVDVVREAHRLARVDARSIGYVECHGTATPLGDPIEVAALIRAFEASTDDRGFCALGSAKANVGHLDAAAGVTGLIKAVLAVRDGVIPPVAHFETPNPLLGLESSPFYVNADLRAWPADGALRRAGVTALGVGGTNVHVVLEQAPAAGAATGSPGGETLHVLPLSARTPAALRQRLSDLAAYLAAHPAIALADVATTLQQGRRAFPHRAAIVCGTREEAIARLGASPAVSGEAEAEPPPIVFMVPGQGAQYGGMGRGLYASEPSYRGTIDDGADLLLPVLGRDIRPFLAGEAEADDAALIHTTRYAQPALFLTAFATARLWMDRGLGPHAMVGHSIGEIVCATLAGVFSFPDALRFVAERGRLMQEQPAGAMVAVRLSEAALLEMLPPDIAVAAVNGPRSCVIAGPHPSMDGFLALLSERQVAFRPVQTSHAFHSAMMDPVVDPLVEHLAGIELRPPVFPFVSGVTGDWAAADEVVSPAYWARHCRACVRFSDALVCAVGAERPPVLLEVGPGRTLGRFAAQILPESATRGTFASLPDSLTSETDRETLQTTLAGLWTVGLDPQWTRRGGETRRIPLPTYPFERQRHWIDAPAVTRLAPEPTHPDPATPPAQSPGRDMTAMPPAVMSSPSTPAPLDAVTTRLVGIIGELSGVAPGADANATGFLDLGFDSLFLAQLATEVQTAFGVAVTFRQLLDDLSTIEALAQHLAARLPAVPAAAVPSTPSRDGAAAPRAVAQAGPATAESGDPVASGALRDLLSQQLRTFESVVAQQLQAFGRTADAVPTPAAAPSPPPVAARGAATPAAETATAPAPSRFRVYDVAKGGAAGTLTADQRRYLDDLTARYTARTAGSKRATQEHRRVLADPRAAAGFRRDWKELVYPIVAARSKGSTIWDVDGNAYVDLVNGYGQTAFGHAPDFVTDAVTEQLQLGFAIGPQSALAGDVASRISRLTGNERVTFCNTGSEAVMAAMRVARAVTGRSRVVVFDGAYHGQFDEVLVKARAGAPGGLPAASGIPRDSVANMVVLPYGTPDSLAWISDNAATLAAVVVEPVQSRHPALLPRDFLAALRRLTAESGTALVFDEVVTGFRVHPGGMQAVLGIRADLATYGKVVGGGLPIGILAGTARFMDALDGGAWQFGDASVPEVAPTFFAGTFVRHPLALAAARAVLVHLEQEGPALQETLATRTTRLVEEINAVFIRHGLQTRAEQYSSWFYFNLSAEDRLASLFFHEARLRGLHIQEGFPCFLTTAHEEADLDLIVRVFTQSLDALQAVGILPGSSATEPHSTAPAPHVETLPDRVPWTEPQKEIWLAAQRGEEASCAFNELVSLVFEGDLDRVALAAALNDIAARHDSLRARFDVGTETMIVGLPTALNLTFTDVRTTADPDEALRRLIDADARTPFDLAAGPVVRATLVAMAPGRRVMVLTAHHIVCDGWSINVLIRDLSACYAAHRGDGPVALPEARSFRHYALRRAKPAEVGQGVETFWLHQYATLPPPLDLPSDRPRPNHRSYRGATHRDRIDASLLRDVKAAGARQGCTLFVTLLAALNVLVARLSGEDDVVIAVPTAGQGLAGAPDLVGHCVNLLPLRLPVDRTTPLAAHLRTTRSRLLDACEHQDFTYGTLVRKLALPLDPGRLPLTQIQFNLEKLTAGPALPGLTVTARSNPKAFSSFDLFVNCTETDDGIAIDCDYNTDLFDATTVGRWMEHLRVLLAAIAADATQPVATAPLLAPRDIRWLIDDLNQTASDDLDLRPVPLLIAEVARQTPDAVAAVWRDAQLTYADLEARANRTARHLLHHAPLPGSRVGIVVTRSLDMLVALLAVLKAGHAYVPLDTQQPLARQRMILADAQVAAVIADGESHDLGVPTLTLPLQAMTEEAGPLANTATLDSTAYVIFTSGSTGRPKGVAIPHRALANLLWAMAGRVGMTAADRLLAVTSIGFDIAGAELLMPLVTGGCVIIAEREEVTDGFALVRRIATSGATVVQATPSLWTMLDEAGFRSQPGLTMIAGGEPLPRDLADRLLDGGGRLWNAYGPTETTIWSSLAEVRPGPDPITIGQPLLNTQFHVLDPHDQLAPVGVTGELHIGGAGLASGYFGREDLTAHAFRPLGLPGRAPQRLYRTGDRARRLPDGAIQLLGRTDGQIKLRGFRIETGEIEAVLRSCPGVLAAAVALAEDPQPHLVGYVVPGSADGAPTTAVLARHAADRLPDYMVPRVWTWLDKLPLTPNGKLDRRALPALPSEPAAQPAPVPPQTPTQARLVALVSDMLGMGAIGIHDNLFSLGIDSIQLFRIAARMRADGLGLEARDLLRHPTIAELADIATRMADRPDGPAAPSLSAFRRKVQIVGFAQ